MFRKFVGIGLATVVGFSMVACDEETSSVSPPITNNSITAVVDNDTRLTTLSNALRSTGLSTTLQNAGTFTLFAPSNEAFAALPPGAISNNAELANILRYHVINDFLPLSRLQTLNGLSLFTLLSGTTVRFTVSQQGGVLVNNGRVTVANLDASNGVVHIIDRVLAP